MANGSILTENLTPEEAGRKLRIMAETTAQLSQNWDNFEIIATNMIRAAFNASGAPTTSE